MENGHSVQLGESDPFIRIIINANSWAEINPKRRGNINYSCRRKYQKLRLFEVTFQLSLLIFEYKNILVIYNTFKMSILKLKFLLQKN